MKRLVGWTALTAFERNLSVNTLFTAEDISPKADPKKSLEVTRIHHYGRVTAVLARRGGGRKARPWLRS
ncbi:hypothetical protein [Ferrimicrobium sp.]|uniref:hypothetical protein n=1 Tax=Ferrimicrobium sp. TaxID=2926050 RepID=UPI00261855F5|nr:hypothetical protein [Ferrimicrobium sp.]